MTEQNKNTPGDIGNHVIFKVDPKDERYIFEGAVPSTVTDRGKNGLILFLKGIYGFTTFVFNKVTGTFSFKNKKGDQILVKDAVKADEEFRKFFAEEYPGEKWYKDDEVIDDDAK